MLLILPEESSRHSNRQCSLRRLTKQGLMVVHSYIVASFFLVVVFTLRKQVSL